LNAHHNVETIGYVHTSWATQPYSDLIANVTRYIGWSTYRRANIKVKGIFFDETPGSDSSFNFTYMANASTVARTGVSTIFFNPGYAVKEPEYYNAANFVLNCEDTYANYISGPSINGIPNTFLTKSAIILNETPSASDVADVVQSAADAGIAAVYLTDDCCYNNLNLLETVASEVAALNDDSLAKNDDHEEVELSE
jgi:hypothetical protein